MVKATLNLMFPLCFYPILSIAIAEVSGYFESGTSVTYYLKGLNENSSTQSASTMNPRGERVSFSFRTTQAPALLLYVSSYHREYIAALLSRYGEFFFKGTGFLLI